MDVEVIDSVDMWKLWGLKEEESSEIAGFVLTLTETEKPDIALKKIKAKYPYKKKYSYACFLFGLFLGLEAKADIIFLKD